MTIEKFAYYPYIICKIPEIFDIPNDDGDSMSIGMSRIIRSSSSAIISERKGRITLGFYPFRAVLPLFEKWVADVTKAKTKEERDALTLWMVIQFKAVPNAPSKMFEVLFKGVPSKIEYLPDGILYTCDGIVKSGIEVFQLAKRLEYNPGVRWYDDSYLESINIQINPRREIVK